MKSLHENWLTEGLIDFEYKKYIVLAYLKSVKSEFEQYKLYPVFNDLIFHFQNLLKIRDHKAIMYESFPKEISRADFEKLQISYTKIVEDTEMMKELEDIIHFALPKFKGLLESGKELYELIEESIEISPVGLTSLYKDEGYLMVNEYMLPDTKIFQYRITVFTNASENYRAIHTTFLESIKKGIGQTYENMKIELIRRYKHLPNPATFLLNSHIPCPLEEALLPVAKRVLVRQLAAA